MVINSFHIREMLIYGVSGAVQGWSCFCALITVCQLFLQDQPVLVDPISNFVWCNSVIHFFLPRLLLRLLQSPNASHKGSKVLVIPRLPIFIETCFPLCGLLYFMVLKTLLFFGTGKMWVDDISAECRLLVSGHGSVFIHRGLISGQFKSDIATGFSAAKRDWSCFSRISWQWRG